VHLSVYSFVTGSVCYALYTVKLLIQAGSQIETGSPIQAGGFRSLVLIEAGSLIQAESSIQAGSRLGATW